MARATRKIRAEARRLFLTGEATTNTEIAARVGVKKHTIGAWRKQEDWDGIKLKGDRRAAEMFVEQIATDKVTLNLRHYRGYDLVMAKLVEILKSTATLDVKTLEQIAGILDRVQKGQRVAKGMSTSGETEEAIRAQAYSETRGLIDLFIDSVKENVKDEETRDKIRRAILAGIPADEDDGAGNGGDEGVH